MSYSQRVVLYPKCSCLLASGIHSEDCDKLFIQLYHPEKNKLYLLGICRNRIRSVYHNKKAKGEIERYLMEQNKKNHCINEIIKDIANEQFNYDFYKWGYSRDKNDLMNISVTVDTCNRPYMYRRFTIIESMEILTANGFRHGPLFDATISEIKYYLDNVKFKKYKTKYSECFSILNKIKKERDSEIRTLMWVDLFICILTLRK